MCGLAVFDLLEGVVWRCCMLGVKTDMDISWTEMYVLHDVDEFAGVVDVMFCEANYWMEDHGEVSSCVVGG